MCYNIFMNKLKNFLFAGLLLVANLLTVSPVFADANSFHFSDATFDYYLKKTETGSEMKVVETLTAEFPNYNQNHGIERVIPFTNQDGTNLTTESADHLNIEVTRNGNREPYTIKTYSDHFIVRIGSADEYVKGTQTYVLKYKFVNVITEFNESAYSENPYQELYWDSNGTGWNQAFNSVTVNLHMEDSVRNNLIKNVSVSDKTDYRNKALIHKNNTTEEKLAAWCYVGRYGSSNQNRCNISDIEDGIKFNAKGLGGGENLSFVTNYNENSFIVPKNKFIKEIHYNNISIDYYLSKDSSGVSRLKVKENVDISFPTGSSVYNYTRSIPFVDAKKTSFITDDINEPNVKMTYDGEKIDLDASDISKSESGFYSVTYKDPNSRYLHGDHKITYEYEHKNIILNDEKNKAQVLSRIPFEQYVNNDVDNIELRLHIDDSIKNSLKNIELSDEDDEVYNLTAFCTKSSAKNPALSGYETKETEDGFIFTASNLTTPSAFAIYAYFDENTFTVLEPNRNYIFWHVFIVFAIVTVVLVFGVIFTNYRKIKDKLKYLRGVPIVAQYTPYKDVTVAVLGENYLKHTHNLKVATMLELIVNKKLTLRKEEKNALFGKKTVWYACLTDATCLSDEQRDLIKILNDGKELSQGKEVKLKHHSYSSRLEDAFDNYESHVKHSLYANKFRSLEEENSGKKTKKYTSLVGTFLKCIGILVALNVGFVALLFGAFMFIEWYKKTTAYTAFSIYEGSFLVPIMVIIAIILATFLPLLSTAVTKYRKRTTKGLDASRYADGLKLYIKMAEKDRIKFLQSVGTVDTTEEGIVKLHEKLLPYAALFGLEKSWMKELEKYYELHKVETPDWYTTGFSYSTFSIIRGMAHRPIDTSSSGGSGWSGGSGGWSSSSSSSGGGGGGYSGGGGGGGGGGGW